MNAAMKAQRGSEKKPCKCGSGNGGSGRGCGCGGKCGHGGTCDGHRDTSFVRPVFFAGQLLTAEDLQQQTSYFAAKNRLRNRKLFGDGVVCGLEVACNPCGSATVNIGAGYAIDCCGNDIEVLCPQSVDLIAMINDLRRTTPGGCTDPCQPPVKAESKLTLSDSPRDHAAEEAVPKSGEKTPKPVVYRYCLYIRYAEEQADPVAPYLTDENCGSQCNWSRVNEGYQFELRCPSDPCVDTAIGRLIKCLGDTRKLSVASHFVLALGSEASKPTMDQAREVHEALLSLIEQNPSGTDCTLRKDLLRLDDLAERKSSDAYLYGHSMIFQRYVRSCLCAALLPPCVGCSDPGVLLACVEVEDCTVVRVCNLERKIVVSPAAVRYWVPTPLIHCLTEAFCCDIPPRSSELAHARDVAELVSVASTRTAAGAVQCLKEELCVDNDALKGIAIVIEAVKGQPMFGEFAKQFSAMLGGAK